MKRIIRVSFLVVAAGSATLLMTSSASGRYSKTAQCRTGEKAHSSDDNNSSVELQLQLPSQKPQQCENIELGIRGEGEVVMVTGGAGFLGQHVVKLISERATNVKEIRVFDTRPWRNKLGHATSAPIRSVLGDVRMLTDLRTAMKGVNTVIHTAGLISFGTFPDTQTMEQVNVKGTANVIQACVEQNVPRLIYTSSVDVVVGYDDVINGDESLPVPRRFLFPGYPETKHHAEKLILEADGRSLAGGGDRQLHTIVLRPPVMYGEYDPWYVTSGLRTAHGRPDKTLHRVGDGSGRLQTAYVGNVAWAHLCAARSLAVDPGVSSGRPYFITDDTPVMNSFESMRPFLASRACLLSDKAVPYSLAYTCYWAIDWLLWILKPMCKINLQVSLPSIIYLNNVLTFSRESAEETLKYHPIFDPVTSFERSLQYYKEVPL